MTSSFSISLPRRVCTCAACLTIIGKAGHSHYMKRQSRLKITTPIDFVLLIVVRQARGKEWVNPVDGPKATGGVCKAGPSDRVRLRPVASHRERTQLIAPGRCAFLYA